MIYGMPRVSEAHLAARRQQILDAARKCFMSKGFHQTSMHDVITEAGLSVGAVYRYFPSKTDLIVAIAEQAVGNITGLLEDLLKVEPPPPLTEVLSRAVDFISAETGADGSLRLGLQVWSESLHNPELAEFVRSVVGRIRAALVALARRAREHGHIRPDANPEQVGAVLLSVLPGYAVQRILTGQPDPESFKSGLRTLFQPADMQGPPLNA